MTIVDTRSLHRLLLLFSWVDPCDNHCENTDTGFISNIQHDMYLKNRTHQFNFSTVWAGEITPPRRKAIKVTSHTTSDEVIALDRGQEMGRFNMGGSTIIVLFGPGRVHWQTTLAAEKRVRIGQVLGRVHRCAT